MGMLGATELNYPLSETVVYTTVTYRVRRPLLDMSRRVASRRVVSCRVIIWDFGNLGNGFKISINVGDCTCARRRAH